MQRADTFTEGIRRLYDLVLRDAGGRVPDLG